MGRRLLAGFLAGVSSVVGLLSVVMLLLISAGFFGLLRDVSFEIYGKISPGGSPSVSVAQCRVTARLYVERALGNVSTRIAAASLHM